MRDVDGSVHQPFVERRSGRHAWRVTLTLTLTLGVHFPLGPYIRQAFKMVGCHRKSVVGMYSELGSMQSQRKLRKTAAFSPMSGLQFLDDVSYRRQGQDPAASTSSVKFGPLPGTSGVHP